MNFIIVEEKYFKILLFSVNIFADMPLFTEPQLNADIGILFYYFYQKFSKMPKLRTKACVVSYSFISLLTL